MIKKEAHKTFWRQGNKYAVLITSEDIYQSHARHEFNTFADYIRWRFLFNHGLYIKDLFAIKKMVNTVLYELEFIGELGIALCEQRPFGKDADEYVKGVRNYEYKKHPWETDFKTRQPKGVISGEETRDAVQRKDTGDSQKTSD